MALTKQKKRHVTFSQMKVIWSRRQQEPIWQIIPYKRILETNKHHPIVLQDDTYLDMLNIPGKDLDFISSDGANSDKSVIESFHRFLTIYVSDFDIIVSQLPADTKTQKAAWSGRLAEIDQALRDVATQARYDQLLQQRQYVLMQIETDNNVVEKITHQEYTAFIYGDSIKKLDQYRTMFLTEGGQAFQAQEVSAKRKRMILYQLNNPAEMLTGGRRL
ncbi:MULTISPECIES: hypothetical protein [unclassified Leuconostoc]|uniref:hypothetical protein n=1 Tax=unclassified Leuconostoc TaxID=2685106 RepID=UPI0019063B6B|nr:MULTISPECIES: hypothetical protein [unclassified Leuconostoc]MBK0040771.1 hypothetical protein [Leuconostoc sp. S51]MBK0051807.1 hypothetical protein [Leuconostoc sp. S50]